MGQNINKLLKIFNHHGNYERIKFYSSLTLRNLNTTKNNNYKVADLGSGYSFFLAFLRYSLKNSDLYMVDDFKNLDKFHRRNIKKNKKTLNDYLPKINNFLKKNNIKKKDLNFENETIKFNNNSLDIVTSFHCIEHFHNSPKPFLKECYRILKPNGTLILAVPNAVNLRKRISVLFGHSNYYRLYDYWNNIPYNGHVREPTKSELIFFVKESGFTNIEIYGKNFMGIERLYKIINSLIKNDKISFNVVNLILKPLELFTGLCTDLHLVCKKKLSQNKKIYKL